MQHNIAYFRHNFVFTFVNRAEKADIYVQLKQYLN